MRHVTPSPCVPNGTAHPLRAALSAALPGCVSPLPLPAAVVSQILHAKTIYQEHTGVVEVRRSLSTRVREERRQQGWPCHLLSMRLLVHRQAVVPVSQP